MLAISDWAFEFNISKETGGFDRLQNTATGLQQSIHSRLYVSPVSFIINMQAFGPWQELFGAAQKSMQEIVAKDSS